MEGTTILAEELYTPNDNDYLMSKTLRHTICGYKPKDREDAIRYFHEEMAKSNSNRRSHPSKWAKVVRVEMNDRVVTIFYTVPKRYLKEK